MENKDQICKEKSPNEGPNTSLRNSDVMPTLLLAGKLAIAARLVTTANVINLSARIEKLEVALDAYDNQILSLIK